MDIEDTTVTTTPLPPGVYYWRARLEDGDSSNVWMFIVSKNNSSAPNLLQPENGTAKFEDTFTFNWSFHLDALEYEIQIDTSNQFTDPIVHKTRLTTSNYSLDVPLEPETYFWRVRYHFPRDLMSAWSDPWWFLLKWVFDIDGNIYETVEIGNQIWMAENLRVRHYRNGDPISYVNSTTQWNDIRSEAYCDCDGNPIKSINYGHLYNLWAVFDARGLPPEGWHIPSDDEWKELEMFLGMSQASADDTGYRGTNEGGKLKEIGTAHWQSPNYGATNEYGFTALPAGMREGDGTFYFFGEYAHFWALNPTTDVPTVGDIWLRALASSSAKIRRDGTHFRTGYSVRCVKN